MIFSTEMLDRRDKTTIYEVWRGKKIQLGFYTFVKYDGKIDLYKDLRNSPVGLYCERQTFNGKLLLYIQYDMPWIRFPIK